MRKSTLIISTLIWLAVAFLGSHSALADIIAVPGGQPTIQAAINLAETGDVVLVEPDTYPENINFNGKQITVASRFWDTGDEAYIATTIIDGTASGSVVTFDNGEGNDSVLVGFSLTNGRASLGGGISCIETDPTIQHCKIFGNVSTLDGAGMRVYRGSPHLSDLEVYDNVGNRHGGGINISLDSSPTIRRCSFHHNDAANGGGIWCFSGASPVVEEVEIVWNTANDGGGVFCYENCTPHFNRVTIANNTGRISGGGILCYFNSDVTMVNSIVWENSPQEVLFGSGSGNSLGVAYSDVQGGQAGIITNGLGTVSWLDGNINQDPLFADPSNDDFELLGNSPCIDSGTAYYEHLSDVWVSLTPGEYNGAAPDMGALESNPAIGDIDPATSGPLNCSQTITLTFNYTADEYTPDLFLYNAVVSATPGLIFGAVVDLEPFGDVDNNFFAMSTGANEWTITGSTVGNPSSPVTGPGTTGLFTITFSATGDVVGDVVFDSLTLRDPLNNTIPVFLNGATITYDCTVPEAVTGITAAPRHNKVDVSWTHDLADVDHFEVHRGMWYDTTVGVSAYPEYDDQPGDVIPTRPTGYGVFPGPAGEWVQVDGGLVTSVSFTDTWATPLRGVYYYEVFAVDAAGNGSAVAAANDRATNYWLGDVYGPPGDPVPNGFVNVYDMNELGDHFGTQISLNDPENILDVGPTDDWSRVGIPLTDNLIDFEDLMVFTMSFGVVTDAKAPARISPVVDLAWVRYDDGRQALRLVDGVGVKGFNIRADVQVASVVAGDLLDAQNEMTFLNNVGDHLDVSVAVTGTNVGFAGTGDLFIVDAETEIDVKDLTIKVRGHDNSKLEFRMGEATGSVTPRVFALNPNYPNPFNPMTKISFSLPESQDVRLEVYGVDGRLVTSLLNETRGPGLHEVIWNGQDDRGRQAASGMYFYRIDAGPYSEVRKMTLMK